MHWGKELFASLDVRSNAHHCSWFGKRRTCFPFFIHRKSATPGNAGMVLPSHRLLIALPAILAIKIIMTLGGWRPEAIKGVCRQSKVHHPAAPCYYVLLLRPSLHGWIVRCTPLPPIFPEPHGLTSNCALNCRRTSGPSSIMLDVGSLFSPPSTSANGDRPWSMSTGRIKTINLSCPPS